MIKGSIYKFSHLHQLASRVLRARHGEQSFLPQWVCATSSWEAKPPLLASQVIALAVASKSLAMARWWRAGGEQTCLSAYFFPLLARHGELDCLGGE